MSKKWLEIVVKRLLIIPHLFSAHYRRVLLSRLLVYSLWFHLEKKTKKYLVSKYFLYLTGQLGSCWFNVSTKGVKPLFNLALEFEAQNAGLFCVFHILNCRNPDGVCHTYGSNQSCMPGIRQILRRQFVVKPKGQ